MQYENILDEIKAVLGNSDFRQLPQFTRHVLGSKVILAYGAGRVGYGLRGFAKRLRHLGLDSYFLEDTTVPYTTFGDVIIIGSGSGETPTVKVVAETAKSRGLKILLLTANQNSSIAKISSVVLTIPAPTKLGLNPESSIQPMTSLFEQAVNIFLDCLVLLLMDELGETSESMKGRHNSIE